MIAKSDLVILAISGTLLATSIYRWQGTLQPATRSPVAVTAPVPVRQSNSNPPVTSSSPSTSSSSATTAADSVSRQTDTATTAPTADTSVSAPSEPQQPVPDAVASDVTTGADAAERNAELYGTYIVQPGDNLTYIANLHGTSVETLRSINAIDGSLIYVDQELLYPLPAN
ncbi:LysM peptidoglycan-binding domain-containing protein [Granulosicoccus sp. 3-233]|uniref:LysM peptidoglycan-binding domain-containing protein n=1 Tax=Granulosicoccus sp. 3-233 TaxID=3417969 RepID=UPI003D349C6D